MPPRHEKGFRGSKPQDVEGRKDRQKIIKMNRWESVAAAYLAKAAGVSFSEFVRQLIRREWDALEMNQKPKPAGSVSLRSKAKKKRA